MNIQLEVEGSLTKLSCNESNSRLCFVSTEGEGFDAETIEELLHGAGIDLSDLEGKSISFDIHITDN